MLFLVIIGLIGLAAIGATAWAVGMGGSASVRIRDTDYYRDEYIRTQFTSAESSAAQYALRPAAQPAPQPALQPAPTERDLS